MAVRMTWTETVTADAEVTRLVELFEEHHAGKVAELLGEYLVDNIDEDEVVSILAAMRAEDSGVSVEYSDASHEEV